MLSSASELGWTGLADRWRAAEQAQFGPFDRGHGVSKIKDSPEKIIEAIKAIHNGESIMNGKIARKMLEFFSRKEGDRQHELEQYSLTKREKEI